MNLLRILQDAKQDAATSHWSAVDLGLRHYWELRQNGHPQPDSGDLEAKALMLRPGSHIRFSTADGLPVSGRLVKWVSGIWYARVAGRTMAVRPEHLG